jgi:hypothetical protein
MKSKLFFVSIIIALLMALLGPGKQVNAHSVQLQNESGRTRWVAPDGQVFYMEHFSTTSSTNLLAASASGSKSITYGINMYSGAGYLVWKYGWKITWSYNGSVITALSKQKIINIYGVGYAYKGDIESQTTGGVGYYSFYLYKIGDICYINVGTTCIWHTYPTVEEEVNGLGTYYGSAWY